MIKSTFNSVKEILPSLIRKFQSIVKGKTIKQAGSGEEVILNDSKVITKERKVIKDSLYNLMDIQFSNLDNDIHAVKSLNQSIILTPEIFERVISNHYKELESIFDTFVIEKKMGPSLAKLSSILISGLLIEVLNSQDTKKK